MVNLQIRQSATGLAPPPVASQHLLTQVLIGQRIKAANAYPLASLFHDVLTSLNVGFVV
jgi:hypothetical protein